jgi:hydrogenase maturation protease
VSVLVLAIGNPQREDDGVAWKLAEALHGDNLDVRRVHQLVPELALDVSRAEAVLFIDARQGGEPGSVRLAPVEPGPDRLGITHAVSPRALLFYAETLYGRAPRAHLLTVAGERFGHGDELSARVQEAVAALTGR